VTIRLHDGAISFVTGYGVPYANGKDLDLEGIVNQDEPIIDGITLKDLLAMNKYSLVVAAKTSAIDKLDEQHLPAHFTYPYGDNHAYNLNNYRMIFSRTKSKKQFLPAYAFDDLNSFLAVSVQAVIQDFLWLHVEAEKMSYTRLPAYFVARSPQTTPPEFFIILPNMRQFRKQHDAAWRRFTRKEGFEMLLFGPQSRRGPVRW
jgi:hypothetical protein